MPTTHDSIKGVDKQRFEAANRKLAFAAECQAFRAATTKLKVELTVARRPLFALLVLVTLGLVGCSYGGWEDMPAATLRPVSYDPAMSTEEWSAMVETAAMTWDDILADRGCPEPFVREMATMGEHAVQLIPRDQWEYGSTTGITFEDAWAQPAGSVLVRGDWGDKDLTLLHELGHAIGLGHADPAFGPSIMLTGGNDQIYPRDVDAAACALGCGPCNPGADPYSL